MSRQIDMAGVRCGRLTPVVSVSPARGYRTARWFCWCDCGNVVVVTGTHLRTGNTKSCGCLRYENPADPRRPKFHPESNDADASVSPA